MQTALRTTLRTRDQEGSVNRSPIRPPLASVALLVGCALIIAGCIPACGGSRSPGIHVVKPGDTLAKIAGVYGTPVGDLVELNEDAYPSLTTHPDAIQVGWQIKLSGDGRDGEVVLPVGGRASKAPSSGSSTGPETLDRDAFEAEIVRLVNEERAGAGLAPLEIDSGLMAFARWRSEDMIARNYFGHSDPETGETLPHRVGGAENVTKLLATTTLSDKSARRAVANWMKSDAHRANTLKAEARKTGVGIAVGQSFIIVTQVLTR